MPKYLLQASYTTDGVSGLLKEGGTSRKATVEKLAETLGGSIEAFYYAFGDYDVYVIADVPDQATITALSLVINSTGAVNIKTTVLISPEEIDTASEKTVNYRPPGS